MLQFLLVELVKVIKLRWWLVAPLLGQNGTAHANILRLM